MKGLDDSVAFEDAGRSGGFSFASGEYDAAKSITLDEFDDVKTVFWFLEGLSKLGQAADGVTVDFIDDKVVL